MSQIIRPRKAWKAFEVSSSGDKMEYLFAASLAIVIIGALVLTIYFTFIKTETAAGAGGQNLWQCQKCNAEFTVDQATQQRLEEMDRPRADCPKCGATKSAIQMSKCFYPDCGKYFVRESLKNPRADSTKDVCPHCKRNWMQGLKEYTERSRK